MRWNVTTPACCVPSVARQATRSSGCCSVISASNSRSTPAIFVRQCTCVSSIWRISSTPSMKRGNSSNCVHWLYAVRTGTWTSMLSSTVDMRVPPESAQVFGLPVALPSSLSGASAVSPSSGATSRGRRTRRRRRVVGLGAGRSLLGVAGVGLVEGLHGGVRSGARGPRPRRPCASARSSARAGSSFASPLRSSFALAARVRVVGEVAGGLLDPACDLVGDSHVSGLPAASAAKRARRHGQDVLDRDREQARVGRARRADRRARRGAGRRAAARSGGGPHSAGGVGPNSTTDGVPNAVARCATPVSPQSTRPAPATTAASAEQVGAAGEHGAARQPGAARDRARRARARPPSR